MDAQAALDDEVITHFNSHAIVLLYTKRTGENPASPNPNLWGPDAVVCDPSFGTAFKANEYLNSLKIHKTIKSYSMGVPQGQKRVENEYEFYDPRIHLMKVLTDSTTIDAYPLGIYKLKIKRIVDNAVSLIPAETLTNRADIHHNMDLVLSSKTLVIFKQNVFQLKRCFQSYVDIFQRLNIQVDKLFRNVDDIGVPD